MSMTDTVGDFLTRIRNAHLAKHNRVDIPASGLREELCEVLKREGYIHDYERVAGDPADQLRVYLHYTREGTPAIRRLQRVSKPGRRVYRGAHDIERVLNGLGIAVISTSHGLMTDAEARTQNVGGEVLCEIW